MSEVQRLLCLLGSSVFLAVVLALGFVWYYDREGFYQLDYVLLNPENIAALYNDSEGPSGVGFVFDSVQFAYYLPKQKKWEVQQGSLEQYKALYQEIVQDRSSSSSLQGTENIKMRVLLQIRPKGADLSEVRTFQQVEFFDDGKTYRVELRLDHQSPQWAVFEHPGITEKIEKIFLYD